MLLEWRDVISANRMNTSVISAIKMRDSSISATRMTGVVSLMLLELRLVLADLLAKGIVLPVLLE